MSESENPVFAAMEAYKRANPKKAAAVDEALSHPVEDSEAAGVTPPSAGEPGAGSGDRVPASEQLTLKPQNRPDYDYSIYVLEHGTDAEKAALREDILVARELAQVFPGSTWEPLSHIRLIEHLVDRADRVAARRLDAAKKLRYRDHQGKVGRTIVEERATVRAQFAVQLMLGLPLGKPDTYQEARRVGNIGGGHEAFLPLFNPLSHHLIVDPRTHDEITCWLVRDEGAHTYRLEGWIKAMEAKTASFERKRQRPGGESIAYWVPTGALYSVAEWWQNNP